jgi:hypothetical protein
MSGRSPRAWEPEETSLRPFEVATNRRFLLREVVVPGALVLSGCHSSSSSDSPGHVTPVQAGVTNGGLTAGAEGTAQRIAVREVRRQDIRLDAAFALDYIKTSTADEPRSGTCPNGPLIRVVLEGWFPRIRGLAAKAEEIYADPLSGRGLGVCSTRYLTTLPTLNSDLGTLYVPGTASTGD